MQWAIIDPNGIVLNLVVYDGTSPYTPQGGCTLEQVNYWVTFGQNKNTPAPAPTPSPSPTPAPTPT